MSQLEHMLAAHATCMTLASFPGFLYSFLIYIQKFVKYMHTSIFFVASACCAIMEFICSCGNEKENWEPGNEARLRISGLPCYRGRGVKRYPTL